MTTTLRPQAPAAGTRPASSRRARWRLTIPAGLAAVVAVAWPALASPYPVTVAATACAFVLLALSVHLLTAGCGLPAFGQAAYLGVGAYTAALLANAGYQSAPAQLVAAIGAAAVAGALTAPIVLRTRGTAFLMATLAVQSLAATAASQWRTVTGGDEGLPTPAAMLWPGGPLLSAPAAVYWYALAVIAAAGVVLLLLSRSGWMLTWRGIAGHEPRMAALGHHVTVQLSVAYTIAAGLAGAGGAVLVIAHQFLSPTDLGFDVASLALLAATIGGSNMIATACAAVVIVAVRDGAGVSSGGATPLLLGLLFITAAYRRASLTALTSLRHRARARLARRVRAGGRS
jgi:branched-chain amino acid transport system permease protein